MKRIVYILLFALVGSIQQVRSQENNTSKISGTEKFYKFLADNIKYPVKAKLIDAQGNSVIFLTISEGNLKKFTVTNSTPELGFDEEVTQKLFAYKDFSNLKNGNYALVTSYRIADSKSPIKNETYVVPKGYTELKLVVMGYGMNKFGAYDTIINNHFSNNQDYKVIIRSTSNYNTDKKNPLIIVNDEVMEYSLMKLIDPKKIESVTILKDASSTLRYGEEGKNGVIIISTKDYTPKKTIK